MIDITVALEKFGLMEADEKTGKTAKAGGDFKWWVFLLAALAFFAVYWGWPQADRNQAVVAATLVAVVILWVSEVMSLFLSALIVSFAPGACYNAACIRWTGLSACPWRRYSKCR